MNARNQYLITLIQKGGYHLRSKTYKTKLLDEFCENTGMNRKYIIRRIRSGKIYVDRTRTKQRKRKKYYDREVQAELIKWWEIFDHPCGQRLEVILKTEVDRLQKLKELKCSPVVTKKLKHICARSIDDQLKVHKEKERLNKKYHVKQNPLLYHKIPVKVSNEWDRDKLGNIQVDCVEHCGQSGSEQYAYTVSITDICTGWHEGESMLGKGQILTQQSIHRARTRFPFEWLGIHADNGSEFINAHVYEYTVSEKLHFTRSRPFKKNDNCFVEQKNWTHVRRIVGYLRYDTEEEVNCLNDLYRNELRLFKNYFQPVMKLQSKERSGAKVKKKYDTPRTPYQRVMERKDVSDETKIYLKNIYESLNPVILKKQIDEKLKKLYQINQSKKQKLIHINLPKKLKPMVTSLIAHPVPISVT